MYFCVFVWFNVCFCFEPGICILSVKFEYCTCCMFWWYKSLICMLMKVIIWMCCLVLHVFFFSFLILMNILICTIVKCSSIIMHPIHSESFHFAYKPCYHLPCFIKILLPQYISYHPFCTSVLCLFHLYPLCHEVLIHS